MTPILERTRDELIALGTAPHLDAGGWQLTAALSAVAVFGSLLFPDFSEAIPPLFVAGASCVVLAIAGWKLFDIHDQKQKRIMRTIELQDTLREAGYMLRYGETELTKID